MIIFLMFSRSGVFVQSPSSCRRSGVSALSFSSCPGSGVLVQPSCELPRTGCSSIKSSEVVQGYACTNLSCSSSCFCTIVVLQLR